MDKIINNLRILEYFLNLKFRWDDEKEYEDFNEYVKCMESAVCSVLGSISDVKGSKRPFGLFFTYDGKRYHLLVKDKGRGCYCFAYKIIRDK